QAEDGIRDRNVTGVQTCALPIYVQRRTKGAEADERTQSRPVPFPEQASAGHRENREERLERIEHVEERPLLDHEETAGSGRPDRSEERRVGKGGRQRGG